MFIKLTGRTDTPVIICVDRIEVIDGEDFTAVNMVGKEGCFTVKETPEQIMEMIENARN